MRYGLILLTLFAAAPDAGADVLAADLVPVVANPPAAGDAFGAAAALDGVTAVVGAPGRDSAGLPDSGAAFVYVRAGTTWNEQAVLTAGVPGAFDAFGRAADVSNDTIVVGSPLDTTTGGRTGSATVFVRSGTAWSEQALLVPSDGGFDDAFGSAVAVWGNTILVGAPGHDGQAVDAGAVYVFGRSGSSWTEIAKLVGDSGFPQFDRFGAALDLLEDRAAIGAPEADAGGFVYLFRRDAGTWQQEQRLQVGSGGTSLGVGRSVALSGDAVLAGGPTSGFYTARRSGAAWSPLAFTSKPDSGNDGFGEVVAVDGERAYIGAPSRGPGAGAVYVYELDGASWCYLGLLQRTTGPGDRFGSGLAAAGGRVLVGAELAGQVGGGVAFFSRPLEPYPSTQPSARIEPSDGEL
jgi:hypothetical protein